MKKLFTLMMLISVLMLSACSGDTEAKDEPTKVEVAAPDVEPEVAKKEIDTTVFEYSTNIELTDAIDINDHITVFVSMNEKLTPGLATQHVVNQTYDFVQQDDVAGAKTISINVKQGEKKIAQFTVDTIKFKPNDNEAMSDVVMAASEIDMMSDEVKAFGKTMGSW